MTSQPLDYFDDLVEYLSKKSIAYHISGSNLRLNFEQRIGGNTEGAEESKQDEGKNVKVDIQILKVDDNKHCVKFSYKDPQTKIGVSNNLDILNHFKSIRDDETLRMFCDTTYEEGQAQWALESEETESSQDHLINLHDTDIYNTYTESKRWNYLDEWVICNYCMFKHEQICLLYLFKKVR